MFKLCVVFRDQNFIQVMKVFVCGLFKNHLRYLLISFSSLHARSFLLVCWWLVAEHIIFVIVYICPSHPLYFHTTHSTEPDKKLRAADADAQIPHFAGVCCTSLLKHSEKDRRFVDVTELNNEEYQRHTFDATLRLMRFTFEKEKRQTSYTEPRG